MSDGDKCQGCGADWSRRDDRYSFDSFSCGTLRMDGEPWSSVRRSEECYEGELARANSRNATLTEVVELVAKNSHVAFRDSSEGKWCIFCGYSEHSIMCPFGAAKAALKGDAR